MTSSLSRLIHKKWLPLKDIEANFLRDLVSPTHMLYKNGGSILEDLKN